MKALQRLLIMQIFSSFIILKFTGRKTCFTGVKFMVFFLPKKYEVFSASIEQFVDIEN